MKKGVMSEENEQTMKNYENLSDEELEIKVQRPEKTFAVLYARGNKLLEGKLFSKREQILYQLVGHIRAEMVEWAVLNVYQRLKDDSMKENELEDIYTRLRLNSDTIS